MGEPFDDPPPGWIGQSGKCCTQLIHNHMVADYLSMSSVNLRLKGEQLVLRTEAAVHVPERIMRQSASRIAHECFRLNYQIPPALACRGSNVDAA